MRSPSKVYVNRSPRLEIDGMLSEIPLQESAASSSPRLNNGRFGRMTQ